MTTASPGLTERLLARRFGLRRGEVRGALLLALLLQASVCGAQNLAQNPGFESGNTTGWFAFGPSTISAQTAQKHSGNYAAIVQGRTAAWNGIAQSFLGVFQSGRTYNISAWVRMVSGASQTVQLTMKKTDGSGTSYAAVASGAVTATSWTQLSGQYELTISGSLTELTLYIEVPSSATASFYADDLVVEAADSPPGNGSSEATVNWNEVRQVIDGFGASSAWRGNWSTALAEMFFSTNSGIGTARGGGTYPYTGIGLSLLRTRIAPGGTTVEQSIMQMAQARGARVWSAPWSPATQFKSNGNVNGGSFIGTPANYQAYANQLAGYVLNMKNQYGINLYALSVQNEPDANVTTYESCNWTAQQIHDFIPYLSSALAASNVGATKIMLPESQNWTDPQGLRLTTMNDPAVAALVGILANHNYVANNAIGDQTTPAAVNNYGKALWQTEVAKLSGDDSSISDGLYWAGRVHLFLTAAEANAWHYWWLCAYGTSNEGLCDTNDVPAKRMYTLGNFSRFVRPGYHRLGVTNITGRLQISAYRHATNGQFAIVAINTNTTPTNVTFTVNGAPVAATVTPWITSASHNLAAQSAVTVSNSVFTCAIPAQSVVTLTGQAVPSNSPPTDIALSGSTVAENQPANTVVGTLSTTDPDIGNTFTYTLVSGTGSTDNGSFNISGSSLRTSASFNYESKSSYSIRVRSTDQGGLWFEKAFTITVTDINEAPTDIALSGSTVAENQPINTVVGTLSTTDLDSGDTFTYTLVSGTGSADNGWFNISGSSLRTSASFDYESKSSYSIRVRSTDQGGLWFEKAFTITVTDVNEAPSLTAIPDQTIGAGITLSVTNTASDPDVPAQTLTFSLLNGPINATLNSASGIFTWRPPVSQADTTNLVIVRVADNGAPSLSATNSFTVTVNTLSQTILSSIVVSAVEVGLLASGPVGPDYTLLTSTNFQNWQPLLTTNPVAMPFGMTDTNRGDPARFYRLELGP